VTPPDNGCIIAGVITKSIMALNERILAETGMIIEERPISIHELVSAF
jgi:branched-subunit amino acid aminotransferase/4-amino-4-deoxychorismate lyase